MSYKTIISENSQWIDSIWQKLDKKLSVTALKSRNKIPYSTQNGIHDDRSEGEQITKWTNGFWGGLMWLMYDGTGKEDYRITAKKAEEMMDNAFNYVHRLHHDVGFMWHIMSGASYRLTGDMESKNRNLLAAQLLMGRYNVDGGYIVAWNSEEKKGWTIIDTLMNIPLLYWATREMGDERFSMVAKHHADMALQDHIRPDGSVVHIASHHTLHPGIIETLGGQGYCVGSSWSRGTAWAVYGFVLSYIHTGDEKYLDAAKKVAHYFIANAAGTQWLPLVDFRAPAEPVCYDSTASVITACGLIEIAKHVHEHEQDLYMNAAINLLKAAESTWCNWDENEDSILQNGAARYGMEPEPIIYGDYFFAEAILKLKGSEFLPW